MLIRCLSRDLSRRGVKGFVVLTCGNTWQAVVFVRPIWHRGEKI